MDLPKFPQPTLLGWLVLLLLLYWFLESTTCEFYCHPLYADRYDWPAEPEPTMGTALPTVLYRTFLRPGGPPRGPGRSSASPLTSTWNFGFGLGWIWHWLLAPLWTLVVALHRIVAQMAGWSDGFVDSDHSRRTVFASPSNPADFDFSMTNDEIL